MEKHVVVEPRFKVGDWVVNKLGNLWHIDSFDGKYYQVSDGKGNYNYFPIAKQGEMRNWDNVDVREEVLKKLNNNNMEKLRREIRGFGMQDTLTLDKFKVVEYFPYTSIVTMRIVESDFCHENVFDRWLHGLWKEIEQWLEKEKGIMPDNKVAVRLAVKDDVFSHHSNDYLGGSVYIGYKDNVVSVGFGVWQPDDWTKKHNRIF